MRNFIILFFALCYLCYLPAIQGQAAENIALNKPATQISTYKNNGKSFPASIAVDGVTGGYHLLSHTYSAQGAWWQVDLLGIYDIHTIRIFNATDYPQRMNDFTILVSEDNLSENAVGTVFAANQAAPNVTKAYIGNARGRYVRIFLNQSNYLTMHEVEVYGTLVKDPKKIVQSQRGDINYFDGKTWKPIPKGKAGQVLMLNNNGMPIWNGASTKDLLEVTMPNGEILYVHPKDNEYISQESLDGSGGPRQSTSKYLNGFSDALSSAFSMNYGVTADEAKTDFNGRTLTQAIIKMEKDRDPAGSLYDIIGAVVCDNLVAYGFEDWYLPSAGELELIFQQLGSARDPFGGSGEIVGDEKTTLYLSSSISSYGGRAWGQDFITGTLKELQYPTEEDREPNPTLCRCVRKL